MPWFLEELRPSDYYRRDPHYPHVITGLLKVGVPEGSPERTSFTPGLSRKDPFRHAAYVAHSGALNCKLQFILSNDYGAEYKVRRTTDALKSAEIIFTHPHIGEGSDEPKLTGESRELDTSAVQGDKCQLSARVVFRSIFTGMEMFARGPIGCPVTIWE